MKKKILVAGGAGFLGSHLTDRLLHEGHDVLVVDHLITGRKENVKESPHCTFLLHDICFPLQVEGPIDEIYNFACPASPFHYQADPIHTLKTSVLGAIHLLDVAKQKKAKIFQASTSEVYGDPILHPQPEEYWGHVNPIGIRSCYDEGKRCAETLFMDTWRKEGARIKIGRIFNTYGPRMHPNDGRVVSNFIVQALSEEPITIYGDGSQTRSFCYIDDLIEVIMRLMHSGEAVTGPINIGNPAEYTIIDLAESVRRMTGSSSEIIFKTLPSDDPKQRRPDIRRAREELGWEPRISLEVGLEKTISYFDSLLKSCK